MLHKFLLSLTAVWVAQCVGSHNTAPSPSPFPLFSPMGRLLSSWPAHGEKRGKGEGDGALDFLFAQDSLFRLVQHPTTFHSPHYPHTYTNNNQPTGVTGFSAKTMPGCCTNFCFHSHQTRAAHCVWATKHCPIPFPLSPFLTHGQAAEQLACPW